ncbi:hypothetical protein PTI98_012852 [Pleurotus ostreatus]|nr:hypothetical protein PTI98_012852 [Pleurotus ostreatus]
MRRTRRKAQWLTSNMYMILISQLLHCRALAIKYTEYHLNAYLFLILMSSVSDPISVDNDVPSDQANSPATSLDLWIGKGRKYVDVPKLVSSELSRRVSLSAASRNLLPPDHISIAQLLHYQPPHLSQANQFIIPSSCFSAEPHNTGAGWLCDNPIPSRDFLNKLRNESGQAMLDGKKSIRYWAATHVYLPFEALGFWALLTDLHDARQIWISAKRWLDTHSIASDTSQQRRFKLVLERTTWRGLIPRLGRSASKNEMAGFLSQGMLSTSHIDTMLLRMRCRLRSDPPTRASGHKVVPSSTFDAALRALGEMASPYFEDTPPSELHVIGVALARLTESDTAQIFSVGYSHPYHWGAFVITVSGARIQLRWGDSLRRAIPSTLLKGFRKWARHHVPRRFLTTDKGLQCSIQPLGDAYSCGIIAVNALHHELFGDALWMNKRRDSLRLEEFLASMEYCNEQSDPDPPLLPFQLLIQPSSRNRSLNTIAHLPLPSQVLAAPPPAAPPVVTPTTPLVVQTITTTVASPVKLCKKHDRATSPVQQRKRHCAEVTVPKKSNAKKSANAQVANGTFQIVQLKWDRYECKLRLLDARCRLYPTCPTKLRHVGCSYCGKDKIMTEPYSISAFEKHVDLCKRKANGKHVRTLSFASISKPVATSKSLQSPCSGLTPEHHPLVAQYTQLTEASSAGRVSYLDIAAKMFNKQYADLDPAQKDAVNLAQRTTHRWNIDHEGCRIYSVNCQRLLDVPLDPDGKLPTCSECKSLLGLHELKVALRKKRALDKKRQYIPHRFQNKVLGGLYAKDCGGVVAQLVDESSSHANLLQSFSRKLVEGTFDANPVFLDLIEVMISRAQRQEDEHGAQNTRYPPALDEFCHELQCISPQAYRTFKLHFAGRTERSFKHIRSKHPRLMPGISSHMFDRAQKYLSDYQYPADAPLTCSVDDTKLLPSLQPYHDSKASKWFLIGNVGDPMEIADVNLLHEQIKEAKDQKATKARLWTVGIPLPNVPPLLSLLLP